jgi:[NiFe] hydrogenase diaphorase moiety large subunit
MSDTPTIEAICRSHGNDGSRLLDIARDVQAHYGCVSSRSMEEIAACLNVRRVEVESLVTFYAFLSAEPKGKIVIRVCDDVVDRLFGAHQVLEAFADELGVAVGETTADGRFTLEKTACTGMSDQAPAALVNDVPVTELSTDRAREIVRTLRRNDDPRVLVRKVGDGNNAHPLVQSMVRNNVHMPGDVIFSPIRRGEALEKALQISAVEVIRAVKTSRLRGRGGAGFPTGMKWEFTRGAPGEKQVRLLQRGRGRAGHVQGPGNPDRAAGPRLRGHDDRRLRVGADEGILYLRAEYAYLREFLEDVLEQRRKDKLLGKHILGIDGAHFDIRIQMGAGAYVCGEETALLSSCEGMRGDPWNRPPFPAQKGYLGFPTIVNNVETLCCVSKILHEGPATFARHGNTQSSAAPSC